MEGTSVQLAFWTAFGLFLPPQIAAPDSTKQSKEITVETRNGITACVEITENPRVRLRIGDRPSKARTRSGDGRWLARLLGNDEVVIHHARDGSERARLETLPFIQPRPIDWDGPPEWESWWDEDRCMRFAGEDERLVLARGHRATELWSIEQAQRIGFLVLENEVEATALDVSADGAWIATGDAYGRIAVWSASNGTLRAGPWQVSDGITALQFDPVATRLAIGGHGCTVRVLDLEEGALRELPPSRLIGTGSRRGIDDVSFDPSGKLLVASNHSCGPRVSAWRTDTWALAWERDVDWGFNCRGSIRFGRDGVRIVLAGRGIALDARNGSILCEAFPLDAEVELDTDGETAWRLEGDLLRVVSFEPCVRIRDVRIAP